MNTFTRIGKTLKHRWHESAARRFMTPALQQRLSEKIAESETRHTGQIRIYVEGGMPAHYIWHDATPRERAYSLFGKTGVWDTENNNGVLIYLLVAEHAIEVVADRGLRSQVSDAVWQETVQHLGDALTQGQHEQGLVMVLDEVTALLVQAFPRPSPEARPNNELPDQPLVR